MLFVVLPQAVRNVLPDLLSNTLEVVELTSLGSVVAMPELLCQARQAQSLTYKRDDDRARRGDLFRDVVAAGAVAVATRASRRHCIEEHLGSMAIRARRATARKHGAHRHTGR